EDAFVPEHRQFALPGSVSSLPGPLWRGTLRSHLGGLGAVAHGVARTAMDTFIALADGKTPVFSRTSLRDRPSAHGAVGRAEAGIRSSSAFLDRALSDIWQSQCEGHAPTEEQLSVRELAVVNAAQTSAEVVRLMFDAAGSDSVYATSELERCFRDVHVL